MTRTGIILLVEDNADDAELTVRAFEKSPVSADIIIAADGVEALDYLFVNGVHAGRDPSRAPELVLLDLNLPRIDGLEVLERIRLDPRTRRLPVVVLTSSREERDLWRSYELGANSFVRKPVDFTEFVDAARQVAQYWLALNEPPPPGGGP